MSWLAKSIANSLRIDEDDEDEKDIEIANTHNNNGGDLNSSIKSESDSAPLQPNSQSPSSASTPPRGVREDLSEFTKTISGKFWGVASFLAPPPEAPHPQTEISDREPSDQSSEQADPNRSDEAVIAGIRSDFAEISGKLKSGISQLSSNKTVSEFTRFASSFLQFGSEEERPLEEYDLDGVVGVTEEVAAFARNIAMHPETWLDFPLSDDEDFDDFELSDAQQEHALAIERVAPRLAALRLELCPGHMSDGCFWKIYFVLLHPRLNKNDADFLSTPQILEARAALNKELDRSKEKQMPESSASGNVHSKEEEQYLSAPSGSQRESVPLQTSAVETAPSLVVPDHEMEKHPVQSTDIQIIDKSVVEEAPVNLISEERDISEKREAPVNVISEKRETPVNVISEKRGTPVNPTVQQSSSGSANRSLDETDDDDADDWLKEDTSETVAPSGASVVTTNDDDVSFSDLEDDDGDDAPANNKKATPGSDSSTKDSRGWVQLSRSSPNSGKDIKSVASRQAGSEHKTARNSESKDSSDWLNVDDIDVM